MQNRDWSREARSQRSPWTLPMIVLGVFIGLVVAGTVLALVFG